MTAEPQTCAYELLGYRCPLTAQPGQPLCILHDADAGKNRDDFIVTLREKIRRDEKDPGANAVQLVGVVFTPDFAWRDTGGVGVLTAILSRLGQAGTGRSTMAFAGALIQQTCASIETGQ
jgi:hypothetical protein